MTQIFAVSMNKGGVGKTSLTTNLAGAITKKLKKKVLIIDTDGQGNSAIAFGVKNPHKIENTIYDVIMGEKKPQEVTMEINKKLHIIPSNKDMNFLEFDILPNLNEFNEPFKLLKNSLGDFVENYDYVFIDCPPSMGLVTGNALIMADSVIIPFVPELFAVTGLMSVVESVNGFREKYNPDLKIAGVIGMMIDNRTALHNEMLPEARKFCSTNDITMFDTVIPKTIRFASATAYDGKPATWTDAKQPLVKSYYELMKEII